MFDYNIGVLFLKKKKYFYIYLVDLVEFFYYVFGFFFIGFIGVNFLNFFYDVVVIFVFILFIYVVESFVEVFCERVEWFFC